jgi:hypothetical protein
MPFAAALYRHSGNQVRYHEMAQMETRRRLEVAFDAIEKEMGVTQILEPDDLLKDKTDERSLLLYSALIRYLGYSIGCITNTQ